MPLDHSPLPTIAISMGDPVGIGPEVTVKALARASEEGWLDGRHARARVMIVGCEKPLAVACDKAMVARMWSSDGTVRVVHDAAAERAITPRMATPGPTREGGAASFAWVEACIAMARRGEADAIVTGPISKEAWALAGHAEFPGHTELLAARFAASGTRMMFVAPELMVMLATTHIPLAAVSAALTIERVAETIVLADRACRDLGIERPRVAVCGVNPHAGEAGLIGTDERERIVPAIERARAAGIDVRGPFPGDTIFRPEARRGYDIAVAMYHDQGLIPVKMLAFDRAVNATIGLPVPRTSPDHGTAFDIAGRNLADEGSMFAALDLAIELAEARRARVSSG